MPQHFWNWLEKARLEHRAARQPVLARGCGSIICTRLWAAAPRAACAEPGAVHRACPAQDREQGRRKRCNKIHHYLRSWPVSLIPAGWHWHSAQGCAHDGEEKCPQPGAPLITARCAPLPVDWVLTSHGQLTLGGIAQLELVSPRYQHSWSLLVSSSALIICFWDNWTRKVSPTTPGRGNSQVHRAEHLCRCNSHTHSKLLHVF